MMHLARGVALQLDQPCSGSSSRMRVDRKFGLCSTDDPGHAACSVPSIFEVLVWASLANASQGLMIFVVQEVLLMLAPVVISVTSKKRRGAGAVVRDEPLAHFGERGFGRFLGAEDLLEYPAAAGTSASGT